MRLTEKSSPGPAPCDLFATAVTKWHALGVTVWAEARRQECSHLSGAVMIRPHGVTGFLLDAQDLDWAGKAGVNVVRFDGKRSLVRKLFLSLQMPLLGLLVLRNRLLPRLRPLQVAAPMLTPWGLVLDYFSIATLLWRGVRIARLDEGFASYIPESMWSAKRARENFDTRSENLLGRFAHRLDDVRRGIFNTLDAWLLEEDRLLFEVDDKTQVMHPREHMIEAYAKAIRDLAGEHADTRLLNRDPRGRPLLLVLTQPWSEGGELESAKEIVLLQRLIDLALSHGYAVRIKLHPRERSGKYDSLITRDDSADVLLVGCDAIAESVFAELSGQDVVAGFFSTSLLSAKLFFDRDAYVVPDAWVREIKAPDDLIENQRLFCTYTRETLLGIDDL